MQVPIGHAPIEAWTTVHEILETVSGTSHKHNHYYSCNLLRNKKKDSWIVVIELTYFIEVVNTT